MAPPASVAIVGLGLIGGSLCQALRHLGGIRVVGVTRSAATVEAALADGTCDAAGADPGLLSGCEVVVLCTPVDAMPGWMRLCAEHAPEALVTDAGSTKAWVCEQAAALLPPGAFLGGHPMAGSERSGYAAADPRLFDGATWVLTPRDAAGLDRFAPWSATIERLGARVQLLDALAHDEAVALVSHLPFAVSAALMRAVTRQPRWAQGAGLAASGLRDMVRIAGGDPAMYAAITATNREPLLEALDVFTAELAALRALVDARIPTADYFEAARTARSRWLEQRAAGHEPSR